MYRDFLISGDAIYIQDLDVFVRQPTLREIISFGQNEFNRISSMFTFNKKLILEEDKQISSFDLLVSLLYQDIDFSEKYLPKFFKLILPSFNLNKLEKNGFILISSEGKVLILNSMNFDTFREALIEIFSTTVEKKNTFNPKEGSEKAQEIAKKLQKARANNSDHESSTLDDYITILSVGLNTYTIDDILNLTFYQFSALLDRFILYYNFDLDIKCKLAGSSGSEADNWMKKN